MLKQAYYAKYFEANWNDIKITWKGIKSLKFWQPVYQWYSLLIMVIL